MRLKIIKKIYNVLQSGLLVLNPLPSCGSFATAKSVNCQWVPVVNYFPLSRHSAAQFHFIERKERKPMGPGHQHVSGIRTFLRSEHSSVKTCVTLICHTIF